LLIFGSKLFIISHEDCLAEPCDEKGNPLPKEKQEYGYDLNTTYTIDYNKYRLDKCLPSGWSLTKMYSGKKWFPDLIVLNGKTCCKYAKFSRRI